MPENRNNESECIYSNFKLRNHILYPVPRTAAYIKCFYAIPTILHLCIRGEAELMLHLNAAWLGTAPH